jgi:hypothetical protein
VSPPTWKHLLPAAVSASRERTARVQAFINRLPLWPIVVFVGCTLITVRCQESPHRRASPSFPVAARPSPLRGRHASVPGRGVIAVRTTNARCPFDDAVDPYSDRSGVVSVAQCEAAERQGMEGAR